MAKEEVNLNTTHHHPKHGIAKPTQHHNKSNNLTTKMCAPN
jgi:hypothetical protein